MELVVDPDAYVPGMDREGNYIDAVLSKTRYPRGIRCPCGSRKDKVYEAGTVFVAHTKSKCHQKWLEQLNVSKMNYYSETIKQADTIHSQKIVIANLTRTLENKNHLIELLTEQLGNKNSGGAGGGATVTNLLD